MLVVLLLISYVVATWHHLFQWYNSSSCQNSPDSVYVYSVAHAKKWKKAANETWPPFMVLWAPFYPAPGVRCGNLKIDLEPGKSCCTSVEQPQYLDGISSGTVVDLLTLPANQSLFPLVANGKGFCVLSGFKNYTELYVGTNGVCIENNLKCYANSTLEVFSGSLCTGASSLYPLTPSAQNISDPTVGALTVEFRTIGGTATVGWVEGLIHRSYFVTDMLPLEIMETFCYLIIVLIEVSLIAFFSFRFFKSKAKTTLLHVVCHCFWLIYVCLSIPYTYQRSSVLDFSDQGQRSDLLTARSFFIGLSSMMTAATTTIFIIVFWKLGKKWSVALTSAVLLIHFGLIGGRYLYAGLPRNPANGDPFDQGFYDTVTFWTNKISFVWFIFLFCYDLLPVFYLVAHSINSMPLEGSKWQKFIAYVKIDITVSILVALQPLIVIGYWVNEQNRAYTASLGGDRNFQATAAFSIWFIALHSAFNTVVTYRIAKNIKEGTYMTSRSTNNSGRKTPNLPLTSDFEKQSVTPKSEFD